MSLGLIPEARRYLDYEAPAGTVTVFGRRAGYPTLSWDGAFIDCIVYDSGIRGAPSFVNPHMAFAALAARGETSRNFRPGDVVMTAFGTVGILDSITQDGVEVIAGDQPLPDRPGVHGVQRLRLAPQDIILHGSPSGFADQYARSPIPTSPAKIRSTPSMLRGILKAHPYTKGLEQVSAASALYRWALICGARPQDAESRRFRDEYISRLAVESDYFKGRRWSK